MIIVSRQSNFEQWFGSPERLSQQFFRIHFLVNRFCLFIDFNFGFVYLFIQWNNVAPEGPYGPQSTEQRSPMNTRSVREIDKFRIVSNV